MYFPVPFANFFFKKIDTKQVQILLWYYMCTSMVKSVTAASKTNWLINLATVTALNLLILRCR